MVCSSKFVALLLALAIAPATPDALADSAPTNKRADLYYVAAGKTYNMHANDHVRMLGKYAAATNEPVPADVVREHVTAIRNNLQSAKKAYSKLEASAKTNPTVAKELAEINKRLDSVGTQLSDLDSDDAIDSKLVLTATQAISQDLKTTHLASKEIDKALAVSDADNAQTTNFENLDAPSYYFTGEGHFID